EPVVCEDDLLLPGGVPVRNRLPQRNLADPASRLRKFEQLLLCDQRDPKTPLLDLLDEVQRRKAVQRLPQWARADAVALAKGVNPKLLARRDDAFEDVRPEPLEHRC